MARCKEPLDAQAVGNAVYGLKGMSSDYREVRDIAAKMSPIVESCNVSLKCEDVMMMMMIRTIRIRIIVVEIGIGK